MAALTGVEASTATVVHQRPALMQDLEWRPSRWTSAKLAAQSDPVQQVTFSFYTDQLFRVVVDYDRERTDGLTDVDMADAISQTYGEPVKPAAKQTAAATMSIDNDSGTPIRRWEGADYAVALYRSSYATTFRMIVSSPRLDALARTAAAQSLRLDARESAAARDRAAEERSR